MSAYRERLSAFQLEWDEAQHPRGEGGKFTTGGDTETAGPEHEPKVYADGSRHAARGIAATSKIPVETAKRFVDGTATIEDVLSVIDTKSVGGNWWDYAGDDAEPDPTGYASVEHSDSVVESLKEHEAHEAWIVSQGGKRENKLYTSIAVILHGKLPKGVTSPSVESGWDFNWGQKNNLKIPLTWVQYDAGNGWKSVRASGRSVTIRGRKNLSDDPVVSFDLDWDETQHPRADDGKFTDGAGQEGSVSSIIAKTGGLDPARRESWYRDGPGWHVANDGERPYGWTFNKDNYVPPEVQHKELRMAHIGMWGGSHSGSYAITGEAATTMGIPGYQQSEDAGKPATRIANRMLEEIAKDHIGSEEPLYHSFENVKATVFRPGDTLRLPLLATAGKPQTTYATRSEAESQTGAPTVFVFPKGTPMVGYSTPTLRDARDLDLKTVKDVHKEFGHVWDEAIIAGGFRVEKVETVYMGSQHKRDGIKPGELTPQLYGQVVHLVPTEVYNPTTKRWVQHG